MIDCLFDHQECIQNEEIVSQKCFWPRLHSCVNYLEQGIFQGVNIKKERAERPYFTKSSDRQPDISIETEKQKIKKLAQRLCFDIENQIFDETSKEVIEATRNVSDIRSLLLDIRKVGAIQVGHKLGDHFVKSAKQLTDSVSFIEDSEIEGNFFKFLKVL